MFGDVPDAGSVETTQWVSIRVWVTIRRFSQRSSGSELSHRVAPPRSGSAPSMGNLAVAVNAVT